MPATYNPWLAFMETLQASTPETRTPAPDLPTYATVTDPSEEQRRELGVDTPTAASDVPEESTAAQDVPAGLPWQERFAPSTEQPMGSGTTRAQTDEERRIRNESAYNKASGLVPKLAESQVDVSGLRGIKPGVEEDNTPFVLDPAKTTEYPDLPERDWAAEFKGARERGDRDRNVNELMRAIAGIGSSISGVKRDDAFYDRMGKEADRGVANLAEDYKLDALARKARADRKSKDPSSLENRIAQEAFAANFGAIARVLGNRVRNMTDEQLRNMVSDKAKYDKARNEALAAANRNYVMAQSTIRNAEETAAKASGERAKNVLETSKFLSGAGMDKDQRISDRKAADLIKAHQNNKRTVEINQLADHLENLEATNPGILTSAAGANELMSVPEQKLRSAIGAFIERFDKSPMTSQQKAAFLQARAALEQAIRVQNYGKALTGGEINLFQELMGSRWGSSPGAQVAAFQILRRGLANEARRIDSGLKVEVENIDPTAFDRAMEAEILPSARKILSGNTIYEPPPETSGGTTAKTKTGGGTAAGKTPPPGAGGKKKEIKKDPTKPLGSRENPMLHSDGNYYIRNEEGKLVPFEG